MPAVSVETASANGIEIAYEAFGSPGDPPVLLVMGLGTQMLGWDDEFCREIADRGHHVVRFDNRDVGLSTHLHDAPTPDPQGAMGGDVSSASYRLEDMADDAVGLLDALGLESAHFVGVSMGGMIVQTLAIEHPDRIRSLVSIMSTTGNPQVGVATPAAVQALLKPAASSKEEMIESTVDSFRVIGSPGFPFDEERLRTRAALSYDRAYDPAGLGRQLVGIFASGDRTPRLGAIDVPTLVIHGREDPLVSFSGGEATAGAIEGSEFIAIDGMGHDLPREVWPQVIDGIVETVGRGEAAVPEGASQAS